MKNHSKQPSPLRVLHATPLYHQNNGILHQVAWENGAATELGLPWRSIAFCPKGHQSYLTPFAQIQIITNLKFKKLNISNWLRFQVEFYRWVLSQENNFDVIIIRYSPHDPFLLDFLIKSKIKIFTIHHTLEGPELSGKGTIGKIRSAVDSVLSKISLRKVYGICAVTNEILEYEKKKAGNSNRIKVLPPYPNGVKIPSIIPVDSREATPELIFIASKFSPWQGLDLLLSTVPECQDQFILHLVGDLASNKNNPILRDSRIKIHGSLDQKQIKTLSSHCWLGLSAFALHRKGMKEACPLKVREYLSLGLPVYAGHKDCFPADASFFTSGPAKIKAIIQYAYKTKSYSREQVIHDAAPYISKKALLKNLHESLIKIRDT